MEPPVLCVIFCFPLIHFSTNLCLHVIIWQAIAAIPATKLLLMSGTTRDSRFAVDSGLRGTGAVVPLVLVLGHPLAVAVSMVVVI